ncbi:MAG: FHA domain-containing protein [Anaerolineales bacterium]|jgi:hypothetical protein|nr:hypothetical protein [Anaerolineales bacterium]MCZ7549700.1 FHA domain-containing protein [Anaerolineales bacterium]MDX9936512.1 DUF3662 domain-containing protein [Anaerolineales bacterium]GER80332.1 conserved hypothetical protein [Candidatus Denitrolinea symbiosum]
MPTTLDNLEARIQELVEIHLVNFLPGQGLERKILRQLAEAVQANVESSEKRVSPNIFTLAVSPQEIRKWENAQLLEALQDAIQTAGQEMDQQFDSPPILSVTADETLAAGETRVVVSQKINNVGPTDIILQNAKENEAPVIPPNAFLIVEGRKIFPLDALVINIGRRLENQLVIDDPRVSRAHAQLRAIKGRYIVFDLNSTGGTFVNGQRASQSILYPGDVVSLAGVTLVFGQDNPPARPDLKDTGPLESQTPNDHATAILKPAFDRRNAKT